MNHEDGLCVEAQTRVRFKFGSTLRLVRRHLS